MDEGFVNLALIIGSALLSSDDETMTAALRAIMAQEECVNASISIGQRAIVLSRNLSVASLKNLTTVESWQKGK